MLTHNSNVVGQSVRYTHPLAVAERSSSRTILSGSIDYHRHVRSHAGKP